MAFFSIIVPVYNVEEYLDECLESIINQTFSDYEIILIDDGSKDKSGLICDEYCKKYDFIKVIHKANGGLSSSRNKGVYESSGEYLLFIDSDDMLSDSEALKRVYDNIYSYNVILLGFDKLYFDNTMKKIVNYGEVINDDIDEKIENLVKESSYVSSACNKCINRNFFIKNNLFFKEGILSEDVEWSIRLLICLDDFNIVDKPYYYYRQSRYGSISTTFSKKHGYDLTNSIEECYEMINNDNISKKRKNSILSFLSYQYMVLMAYFIEVEDKGLKNRIKKLSVLLEYGYSKKVKIIRILKRILGYNLTSILMNKFVRNRK